MAPPGGPRELSPEHPAPAQDYEHVLRELTKANESLAQELRECAAGRAAAEEECERLREEASQRAGVCGEECVAAAEREILLAKLRRRTEDKRVLREQLQDLRRELRGLQGGQWGAPAPTPQSDTAARRSPSGSTDPAPESIPRRALVALETNSLQTRRGGGKRVLEGVGSADALKVENAVLRRELDALREQAGTEARECERRVEKRYGTELQQLASSLEESRNANRQLRQALTSKARAAPDLRQRDVAIAALTEQVADLTSAAAGDDQRVAQLLDEHCTAVRLHGRALQEVCEGMAERTLAEHVRLDDAVAALRERDEVAASELARYLPTQGWEAEALRRAVEARDATIAALLEAYASAKQFHVEQVRHVTTRLAEEELRLGGPDPAAPPSGELDAMVHENLDLRHRLADAACEHDALERTCAALKEAHLDAEMRVQHALDEVAAQHRLVAALRSAGPDEERQCPGMSPARPADDLPPTARLRRFVLTPPAIAARAAEAAPSPPPALQEAIWSPSQGGGKAVRALPVDAGGAVWVPPQEAVGASPSAPSSAYASPTHVPAPSLPSPEARAAPPPNSPAPRGDVDAPTLPHGGVSTREAACSPALPLSLQPTKSAPEEVAAAGLEGTTTTTATSAAHPAPPNSPAPGQRTLSPPQEEGASRGSVTGPSMLPTHNVPDAPSHGSMGLLKAVLESVVSGSEAPHHSATGLQRDAARLLESVRSHVLGTPVDADIVPEGRSPKTLPRDTAGRVGDGAGRLLDTLPSTPRLPLAAAQRSISIPAPEPSEPLAATATNSDRTLTTVVAGSPPARSFAVPNTVGKQTASPIGPAPSEQMSYSGMRSASHRHHPCSSQSFHAELFVPAQRLSRAVLRAAECCLADTPEEASAVADVADFLRGTADAQVGDAPAKPQTARPSAGLGEAIESLSGTLRTLEKDAAAASTSSVLRDVAVTAQAVVAQPREAWGGPGADAASVGDLLDTLTAVLHDSAWRSSTQQILPSKKQRSISTAPATPTTPYDDPPSTPPPPPPHTEAAHHAHADPGLPSVAVYVNGVSGTPAADAKVTVHVQTGAAGEDDAPRTVQDREVTPVTHVTSTSPAPRATRTPEDAGAAAPTGNGVDRGIGSPMVLVSNCDHPVVMYQSPHSAVTAEPRVSLSPSHVHSRSATPPQVVLMPAEHAPSREHPLPGPEPVPSQLAHTPHTSAYPAPHLQYSPVSAQPVASSPRAGSQPHHPQPVSVPQAAPAHPDQSVYGSQYAPQPFQAAAPVIHSTAAPAQPAPVPQPAVQHPHLAAPVQHPVAHAVHYAGIPATPMAVPAVQYPLAPPVPAQVPHHQPVLRADLASAAVPAVTQPQALPPQPQQAYPAEVPHPGHGATPPVPVPQHGLLTAQPQSPVTAVPLVVQAAQQPTLVQTALPQPTTVPQVGQAVPQPTATPPPLQASTAAAPLMVQPAQPPSPAAPSLQAMVQPAPASAHQLQQQQTTPLAISGISPAPASAVEALKRSPSGLATDGSFVVDPHGVVETAPPSVVVNVLQAPGGPAEAGVEDMAPRELALRRDQSNVSLTGGRSQACASFRSDGSNTQPRTGPPSVVVNVQQTPASPLAVGAREPAGYLPPPPAPEATGQVPQREASSVPGAQWVSLGMVGQMTDASPLQRESETTGPRPTPASVIARAGSRELPRAMSSLPPLPPSSAEQQREMDEREHHAALLVREEAVVALRQRDARIERLEREKEEASTALVLGKHDSQSQLRQAAQREAQLRRALEEKEEELEVALQTSATSDTKRSSMPVGLAAVQHSQSTAHRRSEPSGTHGTSPLTDSIDSAKLAQSRTNSNLSDDSRARRRSIGEVAAAKEHQARELLRRIDSLGKTVSSEHDEEEHEYGGVWSQSFDTDADVTHPVIPTLVIQKPDSEPPQPAAAARQRSHLSIPSPHASRLPRGDSGAQSSDDFGDVLSLSQFAQQIHAMDLGDLPYMNSTVFDGTSCVSTVDHNAQHDKYAAEMRRMREEHDRAGETPRSLKPCVSPTLPSARRKRARNVSFMDDSPSLGARSTTGDLPTPRSAFAQSFVRKQSSGLPPTPSSRRAPVHSFGDEHVPDDDAPVSTAVPLEDRRFGSCASLSSQRRWRSDETGGSSGRQVRPPPMTPTSPPVIRTVSSPLATETESSSTPPKRPTLNQGRRPSTQQVPEFHLARKGSRASTRQPSGDSENWHPAVDGRADAGREEEEEEEEEDADPSSETQSPSSSFDLGDGVIAGYRLREIYDRLDTRRRNRVTRAQLIRALQTDDEVRQLMNLPANIGQSTSGHTDFEALFQMLDRENQRYITWEGFRNLFFSCTHSAFKASGETDFDWWKKSFVKRPGGSFHFHAQREKAAKQRAREEKEKKDREERERRQVAQQERRTAQQAASEAEDYPSPEAPTESPEPENARRMPPSPSPTSSLQRREQHRPSPLLDLHGTASSNTLNSTRDRDAVAEVIDDGRAGAPRVRTPREAALQVARVEKRRQASPSPLIEAAPRVTASRSESGGGSRASREDPRALPAPREASLPRPDYNRGSSQRTSDRQGSADPANRLHAAEPLGQRQGMGAEQRHLTLEDRRQSTAPSHTQEPRAVSAGTDGSRTSIEDRRTASRSAENAPPPVRNETPRPLAVEDRRASQHVSERRASTDCTQPRRVESAPRLPPGPRDEPPEPLAVEDRRASQRVFERRASTDRGQPQRMESAPRPPSSHHLPPEGQARPVALLHGRDAAGATRSPRGKEESIKALNSSIARLNTLLVGWDGSPSAGRSAAASSDGSTVIGGTPSLMSLHPLSSAGTAAPCSSGKDEELQSLRLMVARLKDEVRGGAPPPSRRAFGSPATPPRPPVWDPHHPRTQSPQAWRAPPPPVQAGVDSAWAIQERRVSPPRGPPVRRPQAAGLLQSQHSNPSLPAGRLYAG